MTIRPLLAALSCALLALGGCAAPPVEVAPPDSPAQAETPPPAPTADAAMPAPVEVAPAPPPPMAGAQPSCRQVSQTIVIDGQNQQAYGVACQQPDGTWQIVGPPPDQGAQAQAQPMPGGAPQGAYPTYPAPAYAYGYPYPYYGYPGYFGPALGVGFYGRGWYRGGWGGRGWGGYHHH
jgi:hypothetical protein